ncbi:4-amino-4-deoxy-L-arabinose transferase-like glycosyltransferase [Nonomuraea thailandensis]|uniref:4-amino-4-deoxy-L-arabinose transferase-like glycosyltransferase n=1 Tax=Nonomuraea thailandensis TaxID=1188745 RepID=A0A9X2K0K9_9ACTN|nr:hypothetical protein [Nonomuraea thailandensis]MCP2354955.1 4-amino-4-deoxy-L-arabinose transferase-like glycosyltransferase [Nonomuraea thailandensis]
MVAGLLLPPLVAAGLWYGVGDLTLQAQQSFRISWVAVGVLAATAIVLAFLAGSRLSPVASLLGGLAFTAVGVMPFVELFTRVRLLPVDLLPGVFRNGFTTSAYSGMLVVVGVTLLVASLFPSRWRGSARDLAEPVEYESTWGSASPQSPYLPPHHNPEDATRPMYRE